MADFYLFVAAEGTVSRVNQRSEDNGGEYFHITNDRSSLTYTDGNTSHTIPIPEGIKDNDEDIVRSVQAHRKRNPPKRVHVAVTSLDEDDIPVAAETESVDALGDVTVTDADDGDSYVARSLSELRGDIQIAKRNHAEMQGQHADMRNVTAHRLDSLEARVSTIESTIASLREAFSKQRDVLILLQNFLVPGATE